MEEVAKRQSGGEISQRFLALVEDVGKGEASKEQGKGKDIDEGDENAEQEEE